MREEVQERQGSLSSRRAEEATLALKSQRPVFFLSSFTKTNKIKPSRRMAELVIISYLNDNIVIWSNK